jgi:hypothetical protein
MGEAVESLSHHYHFRPFPTGEAKIDYGAVEVCGELFCHILSTTIAASAIMKIIQPAHSVDGIRSGGRRILSLKMHGHISEPCAWLTDCNAIQRCPSKSNALRCENLPACEPRIAILFRAWHPPWLSLLRPRS